MKYAIKGTRPDGSSEFMVSQETNEMSIFDNKLEADFVAGAMAMAAPDTTIEVVEILQ